MLKFYLANQRTFSNRGCEAIVRSTVELLRAHFGEVQVLVPSEDILRDQMQWPDHAQSGVRFVRAFTPAYAGYWVRLQGFPFSPFKKLGWPFKSPDWLREQLNSVDMVLSVGGDNYSLDYRIPSPIMAVDGLAKKLGKPVVLWGASVGPFERQRRFVPSIQKHLAELDLLCIRESVSYGYVRNQLGLENVCKMVDPAFALTAESVDPREYWPTGHEEGVLGLNVSPLIERYRQRGQDLLSEVEKFIRYAINERGMGVLLIPHVTPLENPAKKGDASYMAELLARSADLGKSVTMMPGHLNAAQTKGVIAQLRFFIGARTHATIAALSSGVPTLSIAYSVKARGINRDLFQNEDVVLPTSEVSAHSLKTRLEYLIDHELELKASLSEKRPTHMGSLIIATSKLETLLK